MVGVSSSGEGFWDAVLGLDVEALAGASVQSSLAAVLAVLLAITGLILVTRPGAPVRLGKRTPPLVAVRSDAETAGASLPVVSSASVPNAKAQRSIFGHITQGRRVVAYEGKPEEVLDLRSLGARSNVSLERGPPLEGVAQRPGAGRAR
jgi:hypothetical protein